MIRIVKAQAPDVLTTSGAVQRDKDCNEFELYSNEFLIGKRKFNALSSVYAGTKVKEALIAAQHGKCAYCESSFQRISFGDVEHFRPKGGYRQEEHDALSYPGYYWLAYDWANLFASCQLCNQGFKRNHFPLSDPTKRARCHRDDLTAEDSLLIDPASEDPERLVSFRKEVPFAIDSNRRGQVTIHVCGIDRGPLNDARRDHLNKLALSNEIIRIADGMPISSPVYAEMRALAGKARKVLDAATMDAAEYASASRAAIRAGFAGPGW